MEEKRREKCIANPRRRLPFPNQSITYFLFKRFLTSYLTSLSMSRSKYKLILSLSHFHPALLSFREGKLPILAL